MGHPLEDVMSALLALVCVQDENGPLIGTAAGLEGVQVFDGPALTTVEVGGPGVLAVGLSLEEAAAAFGDDTPGWGGRREVSYDLGCVVQVATGDTDMAPPRAAVLGLFEAFRAVLVENEDLGGVCTRARVASWRYQPVQVPDVGALALIEFTVRVDATRFEGV